MSNKPSHRIYAVSKRAGDSSNWDEIGAAWPHQDGKGFSLKLAYLPLNGADLSLRVATDKPKAEATEGGAA